MLFIRGEIGLSLLNWLTLFPPAKDHEILLADPPFGSHSNVRFDNAKPPHALRWVLLNPYRTCGVKLICSFEFTNDFLIVASTSMATPSTVLYCTFFSNGCQVYDIGYFGLKLLRVYPFQNILPAVT